MLDREWAVLEQFPCLSCGKVSTVITPKTIFLPTCRTCIHETVKMALNAAADGLLMLEVLDGEQAIQEPKEDR